jgi:uncharacterized membrane protein
MEMSHSALSSVATEPVRRTEPATAGRVLSVDVLRGLVMVIMAIDHTRDFVHSAAMTFPPEDLNRTTAAIFFTRWITHVCAPTFMFCAGLGAWFRLDRGSTIAELSRFLWTRGLWLIVLEFTAVYLGFFFNLEYRLLILLVFWALGMSMIALAALIHLPYRALLAVSVGMILFHNLFDGIAPARFGAFEWLWRILSLLDLRRSSWRTRWCPGSASCLPVFVSADCIASHPSAGGSC